jgi:hypothetical protein
MVSVVGSSSAPCRSRHPPCGARLRPAETPRCRSAAQHRGDRAASTRLRTGPAALTGARSSLLGFRGTAPPRPPRGLTRDVAPAHGGRAGVVEEPAASAQKRPSLDRAPPARSRPRGFEWSSRNTLLCVVLVVASFSSLARVRSSSSRSSTAAMAASHSGLDGGDSSRRRISRPRNASNSSKVICSSATPIRRALACNGQPNCIGHPNGDA